jgi:NAD(P)-dependent dehydrogenase (short-subunit alcohol dehydrogenase family)
MPNSTDFLTSLFGLQGQTAVVVGGAGVLGGAIAEGLAKAGANIVLSGREPERGNAAAAAIAKLGVKASFVVTEATKRESMQNLLAQTLDRHGKVDILVNCAGVNSSTPYEQITDDDWQRVIDGILTSTQLGCQIFAPQMASQADGGSILNIGSVTAHLPLSRVFAYSAAKAAVVNLTKNLAREYAPKNVRVNVLCPGFFPAEQNRKILDAKRVDNILKQTPMARFGEPHELVGAALLLCSRQAGSYITGATLYADGGFTAMRF